MKTLYTLILLGITLVVNSQSTTFQWARQMGGNSYDSGNSIAVDASGNVYTAGYFATICDFDPGPGVATLTCSGAYSAYVSKFDNAGNFIWAKNISDVDLVSYALSVAVDASGNCFVAGVFSGTGDFDPGVATNTLSSAGNDDLFVSKLDASGNLIWVKTIGDVDNDGANSVRADALGNVYVTGYFESTVDFDPGVGTTTLTTTVGNRDMYVLKLTSAGNFAWVKQFAGAGSNISYLVTLDGTGNIYTTGNFEGIVDFDPSAATFSLSAIGNNDAFISKLDASGIFLWAKQFGGTGESSNGYSIIVDAVGNVYSTGNFSGIEDFDPGAGTFTLSASGSNDAYISKLNSAGNFVWAKNIGGTGEVISYSIDLDTLGNVYTTGSFDGPTDFDPSIGNFNISPLGSTDLFVSKLDGSGNLLWARTIGGTSSSVYGYALTVDANKNIYTTGSFDYIEDFDPSTATYTLSSVGFSDIFVHKMGQCTAPLAPNNTTSNANQTICDNTSTILMATSTATVNWYSTPTSTIILTTGTTFTTPVLTTGTYTYYAGATSCTTSATRAAITVTVNVCTGIQNINTEFNKITVYPNPFENSFVINTGSHTSIIVEVYNSLGEVVYAETAETAFTKIELTNQSSGIYFVKVWENKNLLGITKIIKQ